MFRGDPGRAEETYTQGDTEHLEGRGGELRDPQTKVDLMTEKAQGRAEQQGRTTGGAEGLKGNSGGQAEELNGFGSGGGRGRLGGTICDIGDLELGRANGDEGDLVLGNKGELELGGTSSEDNSLGLG